MLSISDAVFDSNVGDYGGAIDAWGCELAVDNTVFTNNSATYGGGILGYGGASLSVTGSTFSSNAATSGADLALLDVPDAILDSSTLTGGTATDSGGSVVLQGTGTETFTMRASTISGSTATYGGALYVYDASAVCEDSSSIRDTTATTDGAIYLTTDGAFASYGCDFAESTATDDNDADVYTQTSAETWSDYGDEVWFACTDTGCGGVEFTGISGTFELDFGYSTTTPVTTANCALDWDFTGTGLPASSLCDDCDFGFDVTAVYNATTSVDDGTCVDLHEDLAWRMGHQPDQTGAGYDIMLQYDASIGEWYEWWAADFDGDTLIMYFNDVDYYVGYYYGYPIYATRVEYGIGTVY